MDRRVIRRDSDLKPLRAGWLFLSALAIGACGSDLPPPPDGGAGSTAGVSDTSTVTGAGDSGTSGGTSGGSTSADWVTPPSLCEAPSDLAVEPLEWLGEVNLVNAEPGSTTLIEMVDVIYDASRQVAWAAGQGGILGFDVSDPEAPELVTSYPETLQDRYHKVLVGDGVLYITNRDRGISALSISDTLGLSEVQSIQEPGLEGMALEGGYLFVTSRDRGLLVYDVGGGASTPESLIPVAAVAGPENPWEIEVQDGLAVIADNTLGLVLIDVSDPLSPSLLSTLDVGGAQDVTLAGEVAYVAVGAAGIAVVDISDPGAPALIDVVDYGASVQSVSFEGDILWGANQEDVLVLDRSDPRAPTPFASVQTPQWAMHVAAGPDGLGYVVDWGSLETWRVDMGSPSPDMDTNPSEVFLQSEGETFTVELANGGAESLRIDGASVDSDLFSLLIDRLEVPPGESANIEVTFAGGEDVDTELCIASTDADEPLVSVELHTGAGGNQVAIGEVAPDFSLVGIDGETYRLSEQLGSPVVLIQFATW